MVEKKLGEILKMNKLLHYARSINYVFWERAAKTTSVTEKSLGIFRWIFGIILLLDLPYYSWIATAPNALFDPPYFSLANLFNRFPISAFLIAIDSLILLSVALITVGIKSRLFSGILIVACLVGNTFHYSFGKIDHDIMYLALVFCMIFSNWGKDYALVPDRQLSSESSSKSLALLGVLLAFGMFTAGLGKALNWVDFNVNTNGFLYWFYGGYYNLDRTHLLAPSVFSVPTWFLELFDYGAVIFELSGFVALLTSKRWWLCWLLVACLFHFGTTLLLNIPFHSHVPVYLVFVDFSKLLKRFSLLHISLVVNRTKYFLYGLILTISLFVFQNRLSGRDFRLFVDINHLGNCVILWIFGIVVIYLEVLRSFREKADGGTKKAKS